MKPFRFLVFSIVMLGLIGAVVLTTPQVGAVTDTTTVKNQTRVETTEDAEDEENIVLLDGGAFTDEPRVGELPESGASHSPMLIGVVGGLTALVGYSSIYARSAND